MLNRNYLSGAPVRTPYWALRTLPPFPPIAVSLLQMLAADNVHTHRLVDLIRLDAKFTAELLRIANLARSSLRGNILGIRHAVTILGNETLRSLTVSLALRAYLGNLIHEEPLARVWRHGLATAALADLIGDLCPNLQPEGFDELTSAAGILHQLGSLGLMAADPAKYATAINIATEQKLDLREVEKGMFDIDHAQAGRWIALKWRFSPAIAELSFAYHQPPSRSDFKLADVVKVAGRLADCLGYSIIPMSDTCESVGIRSLLPPAINGKFIQTDQQLKSIVEERISLLVGDEAVDELAAEAGGL